jgi:hypothetical protein
VSPGLVVLPVVRTPTRATCRPGRVARPVPAALQAPPVAGVPAPVEAAVAALAHPVAPAPAGAVPAVLAASVAGLLLEAGVAAAAPLVPSAGLVVGVQRGAASPRSSAAKSSTTCKRRPLAVSPCRVAKARPYACLVAHH